VHVPTTAKGAKRRKPAHVVALSNRAMRGVSLIATPAILADELFFKGDRIAARQLTSTVAKAM
jgi:hypothetical protein